MTVAVLRTSEYRWSLTARCPRMAVLARRGAPAEPPTVEQLWRMQRGKLDEEMIASRISEEHNGMIERQRTVHWPGGVLHPDIYLPAERHTLEVKSTTGDVAKHFFVQLAGQVIFDEESDHGSLVIVDPATGIPRVLPVDHEHYRPLVEERVEQIRWAEDTGGLPDCCAASPTECRRGLFCAYTETAWEGWEPPPPRQMDEQLEQEFALLYELDQARKRASEAEKEANARFREHAAALLESGLATDQEYVGARLRVKAKAVGDSERFSWAEAKKSGVITAGLADTLAPFISYSGAHVRWTLKPIGDSGAGATLEQKLAALGIDDSEPF